MKTFANFAVLPPSAKVLSANLCAGGGPEEHLGGGGIPHMRKVEVRVLLHVFVLTPAYSHGSLRRYRSTMALYK